MGSIASAAPEAPSEAANAPELQLTREAISHGNLNLLPHVEIAEETRLSCFDKQANFIYQREWVDSHRARHAILRGIRKAAGAAASAAAAVTSASTPTVGTPGGSGTNQKNSKDEEPPPKHLGSKDVAKFGAYPEQQPIVSEDYTRKWLEELARYGDSVATSSIPLREMADPVRKVPHGFRKKSLFKALANNSVPLHRANWFVKIVYLNQRAREHERSKVEPMELRRTTYTSDLVEYMSDCLAEDGSAWEYISALVGWQAFERLLDMPKLLEWLKEQSKDARKAKMAVPLLKRLDVSRYKDDQSFSLTYDCSLVRFSAAPHRVTLLGSLRDQSVTHLPTVPQMWTSLLESCINFPVEYIPPLALVQRAVHCVLSWLLDCIHPEDFQPSVAQYLTQVMAFPSTHSGSFRSIITQMYGSSHSTEKWANSSAQVVIEDAIVEHIFEHFRSQTNATNALACIEGSWVRELMCLAIDQGVVCPHRLLRRVLAQSALVSGREERPKHGEVGTGAADAESENKQQKYASLAYKARLAALVADIPYRQSKEASLSFGNLATFASERRRFLAQTYKDSSKMISRLSSRVSRGNKRRKLSGYTDKHGKKFRASAALDNIIKQCAAPNGTVSNASWQPYDDDQEAGQSQTPLSDVLSTYFKQAIIQSGIKADNELSPSGGHAEAENDTHSYIESLTWKQRARLYKGIRQQMESTKEWPFELDVSCTSTFHGMLVDLDRIGLGSEVIILLAKRVALFGSNSDENWLDSLLKRLEILSLLTCLRRCAFTTAAQFKVVMNSLWEAATCSKMILNVFTGTAAVIAESLDNRHPLRKWISKMDQYKSKRIQEWIKDLNKTPDIKPSSKDKSSADLMAPLEAAADAFWHGRAQNPPQSVEYLKKLKPIIDAVDSSDPGDMAAMLVRAVLKVTRGQSDGSKFREDNLDEALRFMLGTTSTLCTALGPAVLWDHSFLREAVAILQRQFSESSCSLLVALISLFITRGILEANRVFSILLSSAKVDANAVMICERILDLASRAHMGKSVALLNVYEAKLLHRDIGAEAVLRLWLAKAQNGEALQEFFNRYIQTNLVARSALFREAGSLCTVANRIAESLQAKNEQTTSKASALASVSQLLFSILQSDVAKAVPTMKVAFDALCASAAAEASAVVVQTDNIELYLAMVEIVVASQQQGSKTVDTALATLAEHPRAAAVAGMAVVRAGGNGVVQNALTRDLKWMLDDKHAAKRTCHQQLQKYAQRAAKSTSPPEAHVDIALDPLLYERSILVFVLTLCRHAARENVIQMADEVASQITGIAEAVKSLASIDAAASVEEAMDTNLKVKNMRSALWLRLHLLFPLFPMLSTDMPDKSGAKRRVELARALIRLSSGSFVFGESGLHGDLGLAGSVLSMFELLVSLRRPLATAMRGGLIPDLYSFGPSRLAQDSGPPNPANAVAPLDSSSVALLKAEVFANALSISPDIEAKLIHVLDSQLERTPQVGVSISGSSNETTWDVIIRESTDPWLLVDEFSQPHDLPPWFLRGAWRRRRHESLFSTLE